MTTLQNDETIYLFICVFNCLLVSFQCCYVDVFDFVHSVLVHLEGGGHPTATRTLLSVPVKRTELRAALRTQQLQDSIHHTLYYTATVIKP